MEPEEEPQGHRLRQPLKPHEHWHVDVSYINISGTFYYLCSLLDGCSRYIIHWEIREQMTEADVEIILQRAKEKFPDARPGLSQTTVRSSLPGISKNSSVFPA
jgi:putative transposase